MKEEIETKSELCFGRRLEAASPFPLPMAVKKGIIIFD